MKIILAGGSGQLGTMLAAHFQAQGHQVCVLSRRLHDAPWPVLQWDAATHGDWFDEVDGSDVVINLAGRSVNCRYTDANRAAIMNSRALHAHHGRGDRCCRTPTSYLVAGEHRDDLCAHIRAAQR